MMFILLIDKKAKKCQIFFLPSFSDSTLANILSPKSDACGTKFELKVDEVLFVGHPTLAHERHDHEFKVSSVLRVLSLYSPV